MNPTPSITPPAPTGSRSWTARLSNKMGAFGITAALAVGGSSSLLTMCGPAISAPAPTQSAQQRVVALTNQQRAAAGLAPVVVNGSLTAAAQTHATLPVEHRAVRIDLDGHRDERHERRTDDDRDHGEGQVRRALQNETGHRQARGMHAEAR